MNTSRSQVVYQKSEHARWRLSAHKGKVSCLHIRTLVGQEGKPTNRVYSAGDDGVIKVWDGKDGRVLMKIEGASSSPITCISYAHSCIFISNANGEMVRLDANGKAELKWKPHAKKITCFQVVNQKRVFTGSLDCKVKLCSEDGESLRQFPCNPDDCKEGILQLQVVPGNLIFTSSDAGVIRVYNMRQELLRVLRTSSLEGVSLNSMQIIASKNNKISIFLGNNRRLTTWYLTRIADEYGDNTIQIDAVKALEGRVPSGTVTSLKAVFVNPLKTKEPTTFLGSSTGDIFLYIPTTKIEAASQRGAFVEAQKFKFYTFKDACSPVTCIGSGGGRLYCGTQSGSLLMWKEPYNMSRLRAVCKNESDDHPYNNNVSKVSYVSKPSASPTISKQPEISRPKQDNSVPVATKREPSPPPPQAQAQTIGNLLDLGPTAVDSSNGSALFDLSLEPRSSNAANLLDISSDTSDLLLLQPTNSLFQAPCIEPTVASTPTQNVSQNSETCSLCRTAAPHAVLYQCGHACTCLPCGKALAQNKGNCPLCNNMVKDCFQMFF